MKRKRTNLQIAAAIFAVSLVGCLGLRLHRKAAFNTQYEQYVAAAIKEEDPNKSTAKLEHAIAYLDANHLNSGRTSVMYDSPETDVNDWYEVVSTAAAQYEKDKNKKALKKAIYGDEDADPDKSTPVSPPGITTHPNNQLLALWGWGSLCLAALFFGGSWLTTNKPREVKAAEKPNVITGSEPTHYLCGNMPHIIYRSQDGHIHDMWFNGTWRDTDVSAVAEQPGLIAACDPAAVISGTCQRIIFRGTDNCIHCFELDFTQHTNWKYTNLTKTAGAPPALV